ncbi:hypothetical protein [Streptomyces sp. NPDC060194]|uniref:hypothetical protein n=1 Tax=Streptomyces sp. NPDC060194 TaxID=3347069 RepID=UPI003653C306
MPDTGMEARREHGDGGGGRHGPTFPSSAPPRPALHGHQTPAPHGTRAPALDGDHASAPHGRQPAYRQVELQASFPDDPAWAVPHECGGDTGLDGALPGPPGSEALAVLRQVVDQPPVLGVMWRATPTELTVSQNRAG